MATAKITVTSTDPGKPWCARLLGIEWYTPVAVNTRTGKDEKQEPKMRFKREFDGSTIRQGRPSTYAVTFHTAGVYEVRRFPGGSSYYAVLGNKAKKLYDPFPLDWGEYMRNNGVSYEYIWEEAWASLRNKWYDMDSLSAIHTRTNSPTLPDLSDLDLYDL